MDNVLRVKVVITNLSHSVEEEVLAVKTANTLKK